MIPFLAGFFFTLGWLASYYANRRRLVNIGWEQGRCFSESLKQPRRNGKFSTWRKPHA